MLRDPSAVLQSRLALLLLLVATVLGLYKPGPDALRATQAAQAQRRGGLIFDLLGALNEFEILKNS